ncbi:MAG: DUF1152 domain-containing protein [Candidatus Lokiarchaeota archaeon]|nr:DUF1152 domain-containing protein [Candidatus Lokiarchaeota archaeon]
MERFLKLPFRFNFYEYKKIFILGLGGGSDIISAYAVQFLFDFSEHSKIIYGNTKRRIDNDLEHITPNIYRLPPKQTGTDDQSINNGTRTWIDRSIPRGYDGCPYIVHCTSDSSKVLSREIDSLGFDLVIGIDTGGDALIEGAESGPQGRDKEMVEILQHSNIPLLIFILAPGCDGESQEDQILQSFRDQDKAGKYLGSCSINPLIPYFEDLARDLSEDRTPNIIKRVFYGELAPNEKGKIVIPRDKYPLISKVWLSHCFVFGLYGKDNS